MANVYEGSERDFAHIWLVGLQIVALQILLLPLLENPISQVGLLVK